MTFVVYTLISHICKYTVIFSVVEVLATAEFFFGMKAERRPGGREGDPRGRGGEGHGAK